MKFANIFIFLIVAFRCIVIFDSSFNEKIPSKIFNLFELIVSTFWTTITWCGDQRTAQSTEGPVWQDPRFSFVPRPSDPGLWIPDLVESIFRVVESSWVVFAFQPIYVDLEFLINMPRKNYVRNQLCESVAGKYLYAFQITPVISEMPGINCDRL